MDAITHIVYTMTAKIIRNSVKVTSYGKWWTWKCSTTRSQSTEKVAACDQVVRLPRMEIRGYFVYLFKWHASHNSQMSVFLVDENKDRIPTLSWISKDMHILVIGISFKSCFIAESNSTPFSEIPGRTIRELMQRSSLCVHINDRGSNVSWVWIPFSEWYR